MPASGPADTRRTPAPRSFRHHRRHRAPLGARPFLLLLPLLLAGCSLHRVDPAPGPLRGAGPSAAPTLGEASADPAPPPWWQSFEDVDLDALLRRALSENYQIEAARERVTQALALRRRAGASLWPGVDLELGLAQETYARGRPRQTGLQRDAALRLDWSPDLFGRERNTHRARAADAIARNHEAEAFRLILSAAVADTYFGIVEQQLLLALLEEQMDTAREVLRLIRQRHTEGLISNLDVLQQSSQVAELESQIPAARATLENLQSQLSALLAAAPGDSSASALGTGKKLPSLGPLAPIERADLLLRLRPDLRAAQALLVAADAEAGRALAERLPALRLSADALHVKNDRGPAITTLDLGAELVQPLLDWGARRQEWLRAQSRTRERLALYSQAFLDAAWEVDGLVKNELRQRELLERLDERRSLLQALITQARSRYDSGLTDYLPVLSATQQLYAVEQRIVRERRRLTSLRIALHRALGGPVPTDTGA